jgi:hypothetical protein
MPEDYAYSLLPGMGDLLSPEKLTQSELQLWEKH